jgi:hypothetical protein
MHDLCKKSPTENERAREKNLEYGGASGWTDRVWAPIVLWRGIKDEKSCPPRATHCTLGASRATYTLEP